MGRNWTKKLKKLREQSNRNKCVLRRIILTAPGGTIAKPTTVKEHTKNTVKIKIRETKENVGKNLQRAAALLSYNFDSLYVQILSCFQKKILKFR